jgi:ADP-heptose:LPS heptosyltransferase
VLLDASIDCKAALADLGGRYRTNFSDFPARRRYLTPDRAQVAKLRAKWRGAGRPAVGVVWRSAGAPESARKSISLADWKPIFGAIDATWVDLQHGDPGDGRVQAEALGISLMRELEIDPRDDLDGLAALLEALDLVVSISTTTVHLAGAVGTPAYVMVPERLGSLWHWFRQRSDSPWYPAVRLFRQGRGGDWSTAIAGVAAALADWRSPGSGPS